MTRLDQYADELETAIQEGTDRGSAVHSLMVNLSKSKKVKK
jgi:hypothetical protein